MTIDLRTASVDKFGAVYYPACGEYVSPCRLPKGHSGHHEGSCLGSTAIWKSDKSVDGDGPQFEKQPDYPESRDPFGWGGVFAEDHS